MYISGYPFTSFKGVNFKNGLLRISDPTHGTNDYSVIMKVVPNSISEDRVIYAKDTDGSLILKTYHIAYGTADLSCSSNVAANGVGTTSLSISGLLTTSVILINPCTSAAVGGFFPFGATCQTAGKALVQYYVGAATAAITTISIGYAILHPQTS